MGKDKSKKNEKAIFRSSEVMMMLEQVNDSISVVAEQGNDNAKELKSMGRRMDGLEEKMDDLQEDVTEIKHKLSEKVDCDRFEKVEKMVFSKMT